jgi:hypothetical protein
MQLRTPIAVGAFAAHPHPNATPLRIAAHVRDPLLSDLGRKHWPEPVPPKPDDLMADVDPAFGQEILDIAAATAGIPRTSSRPDGSLLASC